MAKNEDYYDEEEVLRDEYKNYYNDILKQMEQQKFSKVEIAVKKMMYETREDLFEHFINRYDFGFETEIEFTPDFEDEE